MPCNAEFCVGLSAFHGIVFFLFITTLFAKQRKTEQINTFCSSQIVVSQGGRLRMGVHYLTKGCSNLITLYCIIYFHFPTLHALFLICHNEICMA